MNPINGANLTVSGGYGSSVSGSPGTTGYFSIKITPTNVGGPFTLSYAIISSYGNLNVNQNTLTVTSPIVVPTDKVLEGVKIAGQTGTMPDMSARNPNGLGVGKSTALQWWTGGGSTVYLKPQKGYYDGINTWTAYNDPNLVPSNIKSGTSILGVMGTMQQSSGLDLYKYASLPQLNDPNGNSCALVALSSNYAYATWYYSGYHLGKFTLSGSLVAENGIDAGYGAYYDTNDNRLYILDSGGRFSAYDSNMNLLWGPKYIAATSTSVIRTTPNRIFVSYPGFVEMFDKNGNYISTITGVGTSSWPVQLLSKGNCVYAYFQTYTSLTLVGAIDESGTLTTPTYGTVSNNNLVSLFF